MDNKKTENKKTGKKRDEQKRPENRREEDKKPENRKKDVRRPKNRKKDERKENNNKNAGNRREESRKQDSRREDAKRNDNRREEQKRADSRREEIRRAGRKRKKDMNMKAAKGKKQGGKNNTSTGGGFSAGSDWTVDDKLSMMLAADIEQTAESKTSADKEQTAESKLSADKAQAAEGKPSADKAQIAEGKSAAEKVRVSEGKSPADKAQTAEGKSVTVSDQSAGNEISAGDDRTAEGGMITGEDQAAKNQSAQDNGQISAFDSHLGEVPESAGDWSGPDGLTRIPDQESEGAAGPAEDGEKTAEAEGNPEITADQDKVQVIGVRFRTNGKIYYFSAGDLVVEIGRNVIVETARGVEYGKVVMGIREVEEKRIISTLKPVIRIAAPEDDRIHENNKTKSKEAYAICQEKIRKHGLDMKLIDCEYTFDNNKVLFYFTADGRIDFRELVKDLAAVFKTRIELRQIGVRDETKIMGGIGICGRELCCNTYLSEFIPVSIKMAKEQNLSLNPTKISGACGRLMCCLKNEQDTYEYLNKKLPNPGDEVRLPEGGKGVVQSVNVLRQKVKVIITDEKDEKELVEYHAEDLNFHSRKKKDKTKTDGDLKKLEALEKKERKSKL